MTKYIATIQAGHVAERLMPSLTQGLQQIAANAFEKEGREAAVKWKVIPNGFGWTAGRPSNSAC